LFWEKFNSFENNIILYINSRSACVCLSDTTFCTGNLRGRFCNPSLCPFVRLSVRLFVRHSLRGNRTRTGTATAEMERKCGTGSSTWGWAWCILGGAWGVFFLSEFFDFFCSFLYSTLIKKTNLGYLARFSFFLNSLISFHKFLCSILIITGKKKLKHEPGLKKTGDFRVSEGHGHPRGLHSGLRPRAPTS